MNGWFLTIILLYMLGIGINLANHGKKVEMKHSFWITLVNRLLYTWLIYMAIVTGF